MTKRRLRVLFDTPNSGLQGGLPTHLPLLETELRKHVNLECFTYGRRNDVETILIKCMRRTKDLLNLRSKILRFKPHIIHHNTAFDRIALLRDAPLIALCRRYRIPVLLKMHGSANDTLGDLSPLLTKMRNIVLRYSDCITVLSEAEKQQFLSRWPFLGPRLRVAKNIIRPSFYSIRRQEAKFPMLLFISRFIREKGPFELLDAIPTVLDKFPNAQFRFIGSGSDASEFDRQLRSRKLGSSVERLNHIDNGATSAFYASAWAFVFPTHFPEGMPMVIAEAMAAGVPIITTKTNFSLSYMSPGDHCIFVSVKDSSSLADQIVYLLENCEVRQRMSVNNRKLAGSFATEVVTREFLDIYEQLHLGASQGGEHVN
jgi:glycosyltransferase involved in cell wall biosynthesis